MIIFTLYFFCCFIFLLRLDCGTALKCRTGSQQTDEHFRGVMEMCHKRHTSERSGGDSFSSDGGSYDDSSDSEENIFGKKMMSTRDERSGNNNFTRNGGMRDGSNYNVYRRNDNWNMQPYPYDRMNGSMMGSRNNGMNINRQSSNSNRGGMGNSGMKFNNSNNEKYDDQHDQACIVQCFFNELNLVDQRGFPERMAVTRMMTQKIRDAELRDFVSESIMECYRYLNLDPNKEKCKFSENLLNCLTQKGRERCEDWDE